MLGAMPVGSSVRLVRRSRPSTLPMNRASKTQGALQHILVMQVEDWRGLWARAWCFLVLVLVLVLSRCGRVGCSKWTVQPTKAELEGGRRNAARVCRDGDGDGDGDEDELGEVIRSLCEPTSNRLSHIAV